MTIYAYLTVDGVIASTNDKPSVPVGVNVQEIEAPKWPVDLAQAQDGSFFIDTQVALVRARKHKSSRLSQACASAIQSGYSSLALGSLHTYPSSMVDQANVGLVVGRGGSLWCSDSLGSWTYREHTSSQASEVQESLVGHIQLQQAKYASLLLLVESLTDEDAIAAVSW